MKQCNPLVDLEELKKMMSGIKLDDARKNEYINARWLKYVEWWDCRSRHAKRTFQWMRGAIVIAGALIPALVGMRELVPSSVAWIVSVASIVASLVVAICAGLESLFGFGDIWREKRMAAELIKSEGFSYLQLAGGYEQFKSHQEAYKLFAQNVEELIRREIKEYIVAVTPKQPNGSGSSSNGSGNG